MGRTQNVIQAPKETQTSFLYYKSRICILPNNDQDRVLTPLTLLIIYCIMKK
jgi:hypothetical protein